MAAVVLLQVRWSFIQDKRPPPGERDWAESAIQFYETAASRLTLEARSTNVGRVVLHRENNSSGVVCASPCNEGLALMAHRISRTSPSLDVFIWEEPQEVSRLSGAVSRMWGWAPHRLGLPSWAGMECGWYQVLPNGNRTGPLKDMDLAVPAIHATIQINRVELLQGKQQFSAEFALSITEVPPRDDAALSVPTLQVKCEGSSAQMRWFVRPRCPAWIGWWSAGILLLLIVLWSHVTWFAQHPPETVRIGLLFAMLAPVCILAHLFLSPIPRQKMEFYDQTNLFYVVDTNSEIWFNPPQANGRVGIPTFAQYLEAAVAHRRIERPSSDALSFWSWLCGGTGCRAVYDPVVGRLNLPSVVHVYGFSGAIEDGWRYVGSGYRAILTSSNTISTSLHEQREARLFCPQAELTGAIRAHAGGNSRKARSFVLLLTSASAPCADDVAAYTQSASRAYERDGGQMSVFTVVVPTLPKTGADALFDFEEGKLALASMCSHEIYPLNDQTLVKSPDDLTSLRAKISPSARGGASALRSLQNPLFHMSDIRYNQRRNWDIPRDLSALRDNALSTDQSDARRTSEEIADRFDEFVKSSSQDTRVEVIHALGRDPLLVLWITVCFVTGGFVFTRQCNGAYFARWKGSGMARLGHALHLLFSLLVLLWLVFAIVWQSGSPYAWAAYGDPRWAITVGLLCWLSWFVGPAFFFRIRRQGVPDRGAWWCTTGLTLAMGAGVVLISWWRVPNPSTGALWVRLIVSVALCALPLGIGVLCAGDRQRQLVPVNGHFEWWRRSRWMLLLKCLLIFAFIVLARGGFPASPGMGSGTFTTLSNLLSYNRFVILIAAALLSMGVGLSYTWQARARRYWMLSLIAAIPIFYAIVGG
jgi:hypothetical protein